MATTARPAVEVTLPSDREIVLTRTFGAPRRVLFEAWTTPEHVRRWYGCDDSTLTVCEIDLRPGGAWRYVLRMPGHGDFGMGGVYREVVPPVRLVYTEIFEDHPDGEAVVIVTFDEQGGRTTLTSTTLHPSTQIRDAVLAAGTASGATQMLDRLADLVGGRA